MGIMNAVVNAAGTKSNPACVAVHPRIDCVYKGMMNVEPYKPKPRMKDMIVPIRKFPLLNTLKLTTGFLKIVSRQMKKKQPSVLKTVRIVMVLSLNQSFSCPFSKTYWRLPTKRARNPIPIQSISLATLFSVYFGLLTNCSVNSVAITPNGMLM